MVYQIKNSSGIGVTGMQKSSPDPRCRMVEHIVAHFNSNENYVRDVMNETKVGSTRQSAIIKMIKNVIS
jgi:hypothetical protein